MKTIRLASLLAALAVACGSPSTKSANSNANPNSNPNSMSNSSSSTDIEGRLWDEICNAAFNCPNVQPELLVVVGRFASAQECKATGDFPGLDFDDAQLQASIDAGRVRWDESLAAACFTALQTELCAGGGFIDLPACDAVVTGLVTEGGACASGDECAQGLTCTTDGEACAGVCEPNCGMEQCSRDEICDFRTETCKPPGGDGDDCIWDGDCEDALFCEEGVCTTGGMVQAGGDCSSRRECASDLLCVGGSCGTVEQLGPGATCAFGAETTAVCRAGTVCTNLQIDGEQLVGTCAAAQSQGAACRLTFECAWGLACDNMSAAEIGSCVPTFTNGSVCSDDAQCQSYDCSDDTCTAPDPQMVCML